MNINIPLKSMQNTQSMLACHRAELQNENSPRKSTALSLQKDKHNAKIEHHLSFETQNWLKHIARTRQNSDTHSRRSMQKRGSLCSAESIGGSRPLTVKKRDCHGDFSLLDVAAGWCWRGASGIGFGRKSECRQASNKWFLRVLFYPRLLKSPACALPPPTI